MKIAAVIPTYNAKDKTLICLAALLRSHHPVTPIVVDNGSKDGTADAIRWAAKAAHLLPLPRNFGFAYATNRGIERALSLACDAFLLLNNDATLDPRALELLASALTPEMGLAAPTIYYSQRPERAWYAGGYFSKRDALLHHRQAKAADTKAAAPRLVDFAPLTAALLSRNAVERTGLLDERFFLYYEDVDLALRLKDEKLSIVYVPEARAWHEDGFTTRKTPLARFAHETKSLLQLLEKHYSVNEILRATPALFWHHGLRRALLSFYRSEPAFVLGTLQGVSWFLRTRKPSRGSPRGSQASP